MTRPLVLLRPEPAWCASAASARALGLTVTGAPLFIIEPIAWTAPDATTFDAVIAGSANAFRHGGENLAALRSLPVHAVGMATADAAREAGFTVVSVGVGGLQMVLDRLDGPWRLLRLAGQMHVSLEPQPEQEIETAIVYRSVAQALAADTLAALKGGAVVALHSGEAAALFASEVDRLGVPRETVRLAALGPRIAAAAGPGWRSVHIPKQPSEPALLALTRDLCQTPD